MLSERVRDFFRRGLANHQLIVTTFNSYAYDISDQLGIKVNGAAADLDTKIGNVFLKNLVAYVIYHRSTNVHFYK